jgi:hypothetical protein
MTVITNTLSLPQDEKAAAKARCDALSAEAKANWDDPAWRSAMSAALTAAIYEGFTTENLLDLLSVVERVGETDRIFVKEVRGLRAFWTARGGYIEASNLRTDVAELQRDMIGFHVYEFEDKLRNNFGETQATLINLGQQRLEAELNRRVLNVFQAAIGVGSASLVQVNGLNLAAVDAAIDAVMDATLDENVVIVGRRTMIGQLVSLLTATGNYSMFMPNVNEDLMRRGVIGQYKGATVTTLTNYRDDESVPFWPANEAYVVGRDASKFGFWGGPKSMDWTDHNWYWNYQTRQDFGGGVFYPDRLRRIVDNNLAP